MGESVVCRRGVATSQGRRRKKMASEEQGVPCRVRFGEVEFDESGLTLTVGGKGVLVEPLPLRVLAELLRHAQEVVTR